MAKTILILAAMQGEIQGLLDKYPTQKLLGGRAKFRAFRFEKGDSHIVVVSSPIDRGCEVDSVGAQPAAAMTLWAIEKFDPDLVINAGTAGGFKDSSKIGDVHQVMTVEYLDRFIPLGDFEPYSIGHEVLDPFHGATLFTSNRLLTSEEEIVKMKKEAIFAPVKDMEGAAIVQIARWYQKEIVLLKAITDLIDESDATPEQFEKNFNLATKNLVVELEKLLEEESA